MKLKSKIFLHLLSKPDLMTLAMPKTQSTILKYDLGRKQASNLASKKNLLQESQYKLAGARDEKIVFTKFW